MTYESLMTDRAGAQAPSPGRETTFIPIRLVTNLVETDCQFWVSLTCRGSISPESFLIETNITEIFRQASQCGLNQEPPLLIADTTLAPARFIYFLAPPRDEPRLRSLWSKELVQILQTWPNQPLGFYFAPELLSVRHFEELFSILVSELSFMNFGQEIFLFVGTHGFNSLLSSLLHLKQRLENEGVAVVVFH